MRINTPFAAPVFRAEVDPTGSSIVVSNADNAISIWNLDKVNGGRTTARVPVRREQRRVAHAVAISPDSKLVAYSVPPEIDEQGYIKRDTAAIYIIHKDSSKIIHVLTGPESDIPSRPQALRFSPDGKFLAAVLSAGCGLRIWSSINWKLYARDDADYGGGKKGSINCFRSGNPIIGDNLPESNALRFFDDIKNHPWLITSSDSGLRSYDKTTDGILRRIHVLPGKGNTIERPGGLAISPDGSLLAVGDRLKRDAKLGDRINFRVHIIDPISLKPAAPPLEISDKAMWFSGLLYHKPRLSTDQLSLDRVAWIKVGSKEYIYGAGAFRCLGARYVIGNIDIDAKELCLVRWERGISEDKPSFIPVGSDRVMDLLKIPNRDALFLLTQRRVGVIDINGLPKKTKSGSDLIERNSALDLRGAYDKFNISTDGRVVSLSEYQSIGTKKNYIIYDLSKALIVKTGNESSITDIQPNNKDPNAVVGWANKKGIPPTVYDHQLEGLEFGKDEWYRSAAVLQEEQLVLIGSNQFIRMVARGDGVDEKPKVICKVAIKSDAHRLNITPDAKLVVSGHANGTLRWYRLNYNNQKRTCQFELLVSAYLFKTSSGKWTATVWRPEGYHMRSPDSPSIFEWQQTMEDGQIKRVPFRDLYQLYRPDKIKESLSDPERRRTLDRQIIRCTGTTTLNTPFDKKFETKTSKIEIAIQDGCGWPKSFDVRMQSGVAAIKIFDGKIYKVDEPIKLEKSHLSEGLLKLSIELPASVRTTNGDKRICFYINGKPDSCPTIKWLGALEKIGGKKRFWGVLVGISKHEDPKMDLRFAANDALDTAQLFIRDFRERNKVPRADVPADYTEIRLNLAVSPLTQVGKNELTNFSEINNDIVQLFEPTKEGVLRALSDIRVRISFANQNEPGVDTTIFMFSGHGGENPDQSQNTGRTILATRETSYNSSKQDLQLSVINSKEILDIFERLPGRKIIILDSCRSLAQIPNAPGFNTGHAIAEFRKRAKSTHVFFSSKDGQESRETDKLFVNEDRDTSVRGNSVFTYALLKFLSDDSPSARLDPKSGLKKIIVDKLGRDLEDALSSPVLKEIQNVADNEKWDLVPEPKYIATRYDPFTIRTVKQSSRGE